MGDKSIILFITGIIIYIMALIIEYLPKKYLKYSAALLFVFLLVLSLLYFKYYNFIAGNLRYFINVPEKSIFTPVGISFYTIQAISYLVDVYKRKIKAEKHLGYFLAYIGFFGTILSGPIEKASDFLPQIREKKKFSLDDTYSAMSLILFGLFKKVVIADGIVPYVNKVFDAPYSYSMTPVLFAIILYSIQLYADFSGYSLMALGFSRILGFNITNNFNYPYFSKSVKEFWRRWHISLSSFLKEYVYIPLGGSRKSEFRHYINTLAVFAISGLWHGTSWNFIFWGVLHGVYILIENVTEKFEIGRKLHSYKCLNAIKTFILVTLAWVFFRATTMRSALHLIKTSIVKESTAATSIFSLITYPRLLQVVISISLLFIYEYALFKKWDENKKIKLIGNLVMLIMLILLGQASENQFIYFQF
jgi:D-alanyl-lipoteichoic acid acyltransferase DltB (MBOAT superfamily)